MLVGSVGNEATESEWEEERVRRGGGGREGRRGKVAGRKKRD